MSIPPSQIDRCRNCICGYHESVPKKHTKAGEVTAQVVDKISKGAGFAVDQGLALANKGITLAKRKWEKSHHKTPPPRPPLPKICGYGIHDERIYEKIKD